MLNLEGADDYYNSLSERYTNAGVESKFAMQDIAYYQKEIEELRNDTVSQEEKEKAEVIVNDMIPNLKNKLENIINMTNDTVSEYYEGQVFEDAIKNLTPEQYQSQGVNKLYILIAGLAGFFLSCFALLAVYYMKNDFEEKAVADSVQKQAS